MHRSTINGRDEWEVRQDLEHIQQADAIRKDKKRHAAVKALAKRQMNALSTVLPAEKKWTKNVKQVSKKL